MIGLVLAALSALAYGVSDFVGGVRSRSAHFVWVALVSQCILAVGVTGWALVWRPGTPTPSAVAWGMLAAVGHVCGTLMLMRGLSSGAMHVAGPLSAVVGAAIPVLVGVVGGERPSGLAWVGIAVALPAVWLVAAGGASAEPDIAAGPGVAAASEVIRGEFGGRLAPRTHQESRGVGVQRAPVNEGARDGVLAGLGFSLFYVAVTRPDAAAGGWPLIALEVTALVLLAGVAAWLRPPGQLRDAAAAWPMGVLAVAATVLYFVASHSGLLALVVVVVSLYPAFTVLLAVLVLHERPTWRQVVGLLLAAGAAVLIALGAS
jgi:drug/metabolite transporter (DMT)-like permease